MQAKTKSSSVDEPSEKYAAIEYVFLLDSPLASGMKQIYEAVNLPMNSGALEDPADIVCYFARWIDGKGRKLTGLKGASQIKAILKSR